MNDNNNFDPKESLGPIEYSSEVTESTGDHHYNNDINPTVGMPKEQTALSIFGLILGLPFPILVTILWITLNGIKGQGQLFFGEGAMNAVFIYLLQFFLVPVLSITSLIIASVVTMKSKDVAKRIGYVSFGITGVGFVILGLFLNNS